MAQLTAVSPPNRRTDADPVRENPLSLAAFDLSGGGSTLLVEFRDRKNATIPLVDSAGVLWPAVSLAIPAGAARGLSYLILNTAPDGAGHNVAALPVSPAVAIVRCTAGSVAINTGGTKDGAVGTGAGGYDVGSAPSASTPTQFLAGDADRFGRTR